MGKRGGFPRGGGGAPNMNNIMKQAQKMQAEMMAAQEELAQKEYSATAGGGMVKATVTGENMLKAISINPEALDPEDVEMLEDMILAAVNDALNQASEESEERMGSLTGGMGALTGGLGLPGLM